MKFQTVLVNIILLNIIYPVSYASAQSPVDTVSKGRGNTISFDGSDLSINWKEFLSQHDVVSLSPAVDGYEGFPIGNGDLGSMVWTPTDKIQFQINKTNTWDDQLSGSDNGLPDKNPGEPTSLKSCGELTIEPGLPAFDWMYLDDFEGRISLYDAQASWHAIGPLGEVKCRSFVAADPSVMVVHYEDSLSEAVDRRITLSRWGSRVFRRWYSSINHEMLLGDTGTQSGSDGNETWIVQPTRSLNFAMVAKLVGTNAEAKKFNNRQAGYVLNPGKSCSFDIYLAVVTSEEADDPLAKAREIVRKAAEIKTGNIYAMHSKRWSEFWSKSFIDIPDDYLENLWYLNLYQVGSASLGDYPPHFIGSLWSWNRDVKPWTYYYQWNEQSYTWPLLTSGHPELMMPYVKWKREGLEKSVEMAKRLHGVAEGAFYSDISDRRSNQPITDITLSQNLGPTGLTAMDLWRHYQYTLDREYLERYAYPVIREVVQFYINKLDRREDGEYYIPKALPYESPQALLSSNTTNDLASIRNIFPAFIIASRELKADKEIRSKTEKILDNLAPFVFTTIPEGALPWGPLKAGDPIIAYGTLLKTGQPGHPWSTRPHWSSEVPMDRPSSSHAINAQLTPVFPANLVSLDDKGTKLFEACRNAALSFDPVSLHGHNTTPICYARLGLKEYLPDLLNAWVDNYQIFSQGLFCYFRRDYVDLYKQNKYDDAYSASEHKIRGLTNDVRVSYRDSVQDVKLLREPFAHMGLEAGSIFEATIDEMLLQSHKGKIRVFPTVPDDWSTRFKLHAQGGFVVISERADREVKYIAILSNRGQPCNIENPWNKDEKVRVRIPGSNRNILESHDGTALNFKTVPGQVYIVERAEKPVSSLELKSISGIRNLAPKKKGRAQLGLPREF